MATYSDHAQRELDASDIAAEVVPFKPTRRLPNVTVPQDTELDESIRDAMYDSLSDADGHTSSYYLRHHLAARGLLIVEASLHGHALLGSQLVESTVATLVKTET